MTRQVVLRSPLLSSEDQKWTPETTSPATETKTKDINNSSTKCGEVVGGAAADCTAVCCCCPCFAMNLLVLAVYKVPTGLCKKALRRNKRHRMKRKRQGLLADPSGNEGSGSWPSRTMIEDVEFVAEKNKDCGDSGDRTTDTENEMWDRFYGAGFWRSPSQRNAC